MYIWHRYPEFFRGRLCTLHRLGASWEYQAPSAPVRAVAEGEPIGRRFAGVRPILTVSTTKARRLGLPVGNPSCRLAGARAKASGRAFEQVIEEANAHYEQTGTAVVYRHHPKVEGWGCTLRVTGRGPADFSGVVRLSDEQTIAIAFDCKVVTGQAGYAHAERDRHQVESLLRFRAAGGLAFLLLHCRTLDRIWLLEDLDALMRRERVPIRRQRPVGVVQLLPALEPSSLLDVARGIRSLWDYVRLVHACSAGHRT